MKIAQVNLQKAWGGAEKHVSLLSRSLHEAGHAVVVCCHPRGRLRQDATSRGMPSLPVTAINQMDLTVGVKLAAGLFRFRPDIIHVHTPRDYIGGLLASRLLPGTMLVLTRHMMLPVKPMMRRLYARTQGIFCFSAGMRRFLEAQGVPPRLLYRVRSGIDTAEFNTSSALERRETIRREWRLSSHDLIVGAVGRLVPGKGHSLLLETHCRLRKSGTSADAMRVRLVFVGEGPERTRLEQQARELGLTDSVHFAGFRNDIAATLAALDIFALPSQSELLPLSVMEAMAAGLPALATDVGCLAELIETEVTGLLTPPDEPQLLLEALLRLTKDSALRLRLGHAAVARAHRDFTLEAMASDALEAYHHILTSQMPQ
jgi:glycosyltransferase involved in cell wall biosynthesis